ncbi:hypothetical protein FOXG_15855 [Fusarium oxysporum f. sp. lycopersici 4287]|uniref:Uncharacterized protein n=2 Tax=Fusarium oxysporum TaxID=5507 RepID=A0A0J9W5S7_FUSO4|nr:hypothetical protein FOXG_15855 [Fusarium oxysporum f. sp. lycopersici 4287]KNB18424.1 hypothetical protein FOXG_15855 [Fusarium oxysporum f. sp. lycopersici 4287]
MYLSPVKPSSMDESLGSEITVSTTPPLVALRRLPKEYIQLLESNSSSITSRLSLWELYGLPFSMRFRNQVSITSATLLCSYKPRT